MCTKGEEGKERETRAKVSFSVVLDWFKPGTHLELLICALSSPGLYEALLPHPCDIQKSAHCS